MELTHGVVELTLGVVELTLRVVELTLGVVELTPGVVELPFVLRQAQDDRLRVTKEVLKMK